MAHNALAAVASAALVAAAALALAAPVRADTITDGSLAVDIESDGEFNEITLNGTDIDTSGFFQQYVVNGSFDFTEVTSVVAVGDTATYTATAGGDNFGVAVTSRILGPLASNPTTTNVLQQVLTFTNTTAGDLSLRLISDIDQDLKDGSDGDVVAYDAARGATFAVDSTGSDPSQLFGAVAATDAAGATFGYSVGFLGGQSLDFPTSDNSGPIGPGDTAMSLGFDFGTVGAGGSVTVEFRYLAAIGLTGVPADFAVPEPTAAGLLGAAGLGLLARRRRA